MIYDERYRNQVFWDVPHGPDYASLKRKLIDLAMNGQNRITPPAGKDSKTIGIGALAALVLAVLAGVITHFVTGAGIGAAVVGFIVFFLAGTVTALIIARNRLLVRPKLMTQEVNAMCVGYSITGNDGHINRTPVFKYTYAGREYLAYDGIYSNRGRLPEIDSTVTIKVDPEDPAEFIWSDNNQKTFVFAAVICAIMILTEIAMIVIILSDKGLMGS